MLVRPTAVPDSAGRTVIYTSAAQRRWVAFGLMLLALLALAMLVDKSQEKGLGHDEHQFVSPGIMTMREGLLPYRDYPLFHVPYLVLLHGALAAWVPYKMLVVRLFTALAAWGTVLLMGRWAWRNMAIPNAWWRVAAVGAVGTLFLLPPVTAYTVRMIWNHATPVFFFIAAWLVLAGAAESEKRGWRCFGAGLLLGVAAGMRVSFLPLCAPFGLAAFLLLPTAHWRARCRQAGCFSAGLVLAGLPLAWLIWQAPEAFLFDNFTTPTFAQVWRALPFYRPDIDSFVSPVSGLLPQTPLPPRALTLSQKLAFLRLSPLRESLLPILLGPLLTLLALAAVLWRERRLSFVAVFALFCWPFVLWGCWAPARVNSQYYYVAVAYGALLVAVGVAGLLPFISRRVLVSMLGVAAGVSVFFGWREYDDLRLVYKVRKWRGVRDHRDFVEIAQRAGPGDVLTLKALHLQEGGARIYPEFSSHEFPWRLAHLFSEEKRRRYRLITPRELAAQFADRLPAAIVVGRGRSDEMELPLIEFAEAHGYVPVDAKQTIWRRPTTP